MEKEFDIKLRGWTMTVCMTENWIVMDCNNKVGLSGGSHGGGYQPMLCENLCEKNFPK